MADWIAVEDPHSGLVYYRNMKTTETSLEKPFGYRPQRGRSRGTRARGVRGRGRYGHSYGARGMRGRGIRGRGRGRERGRYGQPYGGRGRAVRGRGGFRRITINNDELKKGIVARLDKLQENGENMRDYCSCLLIKYTDEDEQEENEARMLLEKWNLQQHYHRFKEKGWDDITMWNELINLEDELNDLFKLKTGHKFKFKKYVQKEDSIASIKNENNSQVSNWSKQDIVEWIENIGLTDAWREIAVNSVQNGEYNGHNMIKLKSGKDIAKLFALNNPMLCNRLWKEFKKIK